MTTEERQRNRIAELSEALMMLTEMARGEVHTNTGRLKGSPSWARAIELSDATLAGKPAPVDAARQAGAI